MIVRKTKQEEGKRVNELFSIAFELPLEDGPAETELNPRVHHWAAFEEESGQMMSTFTISDFQIQFDKNSCKMGGIGGVATLPQYRRMGGIRGCFQKALPDMYKNDYDFSYLYPFSTAYYRKFGYECCVQKMHVSINLGLLKPETAAGRYYLCEADHPLAGAIHSIDDIWETQYNMMVLHDADDYKWTAEFNPAGKQEFTYVYFDGAKLPKAYTTFRKVDESDGRNLVCSRFCFVDKDGFNGLMELFKSLSADHMFVKFALPCSASMEYLFPEWAMGAAQWYIRNAGMVRVIHAENVFRKAAYIGSGSIAISVKDPQIPDNEHTYKIVFLNGRAVSVDITEETPDIVLSISALSALISGAADFQSAEQWMKGIEVLNANAPLQQVFYRKNLMIADYF